MGHGNDKERDEKGGAEERSGKAGPRMQVGRHDGGRAEGLLIEWLLK